MFQYGIFCMSLLGLLVGTPAQRSPYLGSSDPGVLPMYLSENTDNRFGGGNSPAATAASSAAAAPAASSAAAAAPAAAPAPYEPPKMHGGTLETEDVYNRVSQWPDQHKPFWYLNAVAIQKQREQQQQQAAAAAQAQQAAAQNRSPFAAGSSRLSRGNAQPAQNSFRRSSRGVAY